MARNAMPRRNVGLCSSQCRQSALTSAQYSPSLRTDLFSRYEAKASGSVARSWAAETDCGEIRIRLCDPLAHGSAQELQPFRRRLRCLRHGRRTLESEAGAGHDILDRIAGMHACQREATRTAIE